MAMTLLDYQELLRNLPQAQVVGAAKTGDPRSWMAADELKRRQEMRDAEKAELAVQEQSPRNVVEEYVSMASPVPGMQPPGPGAMPGMPQAPPSPMGPQGPPMGPQGPPMGPPMPPQGFQRGGPIHPNARRLSHLGRGGDTALMHVRPRDVNERATSINPQTGLPEAFDPTGGAASAALAMAGLFALRRFGPQLLGKVAPGLAKKVGMKSGKAAVETLQKAGEKTAFSGGLAAGEVLPIGPGGAMVKIPGKAPGGGKPPSSAPGGWWGRGKKALPYAAVGGLGYYGLSGGEGEEQTIPPPFLPPGSDPGGPGTGRLEELQERIQAASPGMTKMPEWLGGGELPLDQWGKQLTQFGSTLATTPGEFGEGFGAALGAAGQVPEQIRGEQRAALAEEIAVEQLSIEAALKIALQEAKMSGGVMTFPAFVELMMKNTDPLMLAPDGGDPIQPLFEMWSKWFSPGELPGRPDEEWKEVPDNVES